MRRRSKVYQDAALCAFLALVASWLGFRVYDLAEKAEIAWRAAEASKLEAAALSAREADLSAQITELETPRGKDAAIRTAFDVAKPGEEVIIVVPPKEATTTPPEPWWHKVLDWF
jgi:hypothetical protein